MVRVRVRARVRLRVRVRRQGRVRVRRSSYEVAAVAAHHAVDGQPLPLPLLVILDVDELRGRQQPVAQRRELVAQPDEVAHHEELVGLVRVRVEVRVRIRVRVRVRVRVS